MKTITYFNYGGVNGETEKIMEVLIRIKNPGSKTNQKTLRRRKWNK